MGSKRNRNKGGKRRGRNRSTSSLAQHKRVGNVVKPPFAAMSDDLNVKTTIWFRDDLPNHLWVLGHLAEDADRGMRLVADALAEVRQILDELGQKTTITGTLFSFESVPEEHRPAVLTALADAGTYDRFFPADWAQAISLYDEAPARWTAQLHLDAGLGPDELAGRRWLGAAIEGGSHGQSLAATRSKMFVVAGFLHAGLLHNLPPDIGEMGTRYPNIEEDERRQFEPTMRATYGALAQLDEEDESRTAWARQFWSANWRLYECEPLDLEEDADGKSSDTHGAEVGEQRQRIFEYFTNRLDQLDSRFCKASDCDPDIYNPDRYEVLTGLTARLIRQAFAAAHTPLMWTPDFGAWLLRSSVETKIVVAWLEHTGGDIYGGYKTYGRGKLKLLKLHLEEYVDENADDLDPAVNEYLETLTDEVNQDIWEEFQEISIEKTFSGVNARKMAIEVNLKPDYDLAFAPASGMAHGDWVALDREALTRCANPLHRWHRINRTSMRRVLAPELMDQVIDFVEDVVGLYERAMATTTQATEDQPTSPDDCA